ncbi:hypothetical protein [Fibrobacter succinogenes]|uniref:hypothetical protein n=1 Tax=Fibrobacter succinogenes TaxID=833 RepID=UPI001568ACAB|nr:hypothetical protein [Fibrobacter succinogenes]
MQTTYTRKNDAIQRTAENSAASVNDSSSQIKSLQRKADMANAAAQRAVAPRPNNTGMPVNCNDVIQCFNCPAYFETENDEGCPNSRYYVFRDHLVRIAPINTRRFPTQEYHEERRNFVYVQSDAAREFLEDRPMLMKKIEESDYSKDVATLDFEVECNGVKLGFFKRWRKKNSLKELNKNYYSQISRTPQIGLSPFDWDDESSHPGHPITSKEVFKDDAGLQKKLDEEKNLDIYRNRNEHANIFAGEHAKEIQDALNQNLGWHYGPENPTTANEEDFEESNRMNMDTYFEFLWDLALDDAEAGDGVERSRDIFDERFADDGIVKSYFARLPRFTGGSIDEK